LTGATLVALSPALQASSNGFSFDAQGRLALYDATAGLPAGAVYAQGFAFKPTGELCISQTSAIATYSNGVPVDTLGRVCMPIASFILDLLSGVLPSNATFVRGTNATVVNSLGQLVWAPANMLVNTVNTGAVSGPPSGTAPTGWVFIASGSSGNATFDGNGGIRFTCAGGRPAIGQSITFEAFAAYTLSCTYTANPSGAQVGTSFLINNAALTGSSVSYTLNGNAILSTYVPVAGDRIACVLVLAGTGGSAQVRIGPGANNTDTADVTMRDFKLERGAVATDYIANTSTSVGYYGPRFDYDPVTRALLGLLIEEQSINQLNMNTVDPVIGQWIFTSGGGTSSMTVVTDTAELLRAGLTLGTTVIKLDNSGGASVAFASTGLSAVTTGAMTASAYIRGTGTLATPQISADFASSLNTIALVAGAAYSRFSCTSTPPSGTTYRASFSAPVGGIVYIALVNYENRVDGPTSYIPTFGSAATRAFDNCSTPTAGWLAANVGTWVSEFRKQATQATSWAVAWLDGSGRPAYNFGSNSTEIRAYDGTQVVGLGLAYPTITKFALAVGATAGTQMRASANGLAAVSVAYDGSFGTVTSNLYVGCDGGGQQINGHVRKISYFPLALPDSTLQSLSD
jgi:hypothetical protein